MNRFLLIISLLWLAVSMLPAQNPCGTLPGKSKWLKDFQQHRLQQALMEDDTILYVPLTIHMVGEDDGTTFTTLETIAKSLCNLNDDFAQANIQFFVEGDFRYIANTAYNNHETVIEGAEMMFAHNVEHTINCYVVSDPAGNCGYNLPYAGIALSKGCLTGHTWAHELGHAFRLPHPFLGWEGDQYMQGDTAPWTVTYDYTYFKDTLILDTLIIDTAFVELVDKSNCTIAADGFCDTEPDYLSNRWNCSGQNNSTVVQTDPNGATFVSDGSLIMSYSDSDCQSRFSDEQIATMRTYIQEERPDLLYNQNPLGPVPAEKVTLLTPEDEELTDPNHTKLTWSSAENATTYHLVVAKSKFLTSGIVIDTMVMDTSFVMSGLEHQTNHFWKVQPFNAFSFCGVRSSRGKFVPDESIVSVQEINQTEWSISRTIFPKGSQIHITYQQKNPQLPASIVVDAYGKRLDTNSDFDTLNERIQLPANMASGLYFISNPALGLISKIMVF